MLDLEPRNPYLADATDPNVRKSLDGLYRRLSITMTDFPKFKCGGTSRAVELLGFYVTHGSFELDFATAEYPNLEAGHTWCEDRFGRIVDLTLAQFNECLYEPVPVGVLVIEPDCLLFERYYFKKS